MFFHKAHPFPISHIPPYPFNKHDELKEYDAISIEMLPSAREQQRKGVSSSNRAILQGTSGNGAVVCRCVHEWRRIIIISLLHRAKDSSPSSTKSARGGGAAVCNVFRLFSFVRDGQKGVRWEIRFT